MFSKFETYHANKRQSLAKLTRGVFFYLHDFFQLCLEDIIFLFFHGQAVSHCFNQSANGTEAYP